MGTHKLSYSSFQVYANDTSSTVAVRANGSGVTKVPTSTNPLVNSRKTLVAAIAALSEYAYTLRIHSAFKSGLSMPGYSRI